MYAGTSACDPNHKALSFLSAHPEKMQILPKLEGLVMQITIDATCGHRAYTWNG